MAQYRLSNSIISRSKGKSAVAAAAYRSGSVLKDDRLDIVHDYSKKENVAWTMILAPDAAPGWVYDRQELWNQVEARESRRDSQVARECLVALPKELSLEQNIVLVRDFAIEEFVNKGMIADIGLHNVSGNPHAHILLTLRELEAEGFGLKNREWNHRSLLREQRQSWASYCNRALEAAGIDERVDHRTLAAQGIVRIPQIHLGSHAAQCLKEERYHPRLERYFEIERANAELAQLQGELTQIDDQIQAETQQQFDWANQILPVACETILQRIQAGDVIDCGSNRWGIRQANYQIFLAQPSETEWQLELYSQHGVLATESRQGEQQTVEIDQGFSAQDVQYFARLHQRLIEQQRIQAEQERLEQERLQREREQKEREHLEQQRLEQERLQQVCQMYQQTYERIAGTNLLGETNEQRDLRVADQAYQNAIAQGFDIGKAEEYTQQIVGYGGAIAQEKLFQFGETEALHYAGSIAAQAAENWQYNQAAQILSTAIDFFRHGSNAGEAVERSPHEFAVQCKRYTLVARFEITDAGQETRLSVEAIGRGELARCCRFPGSSLDDWQMEMAQNIEPQDTRIFEAAAVWLQQQKERTPRNQPQTAQNQQLELG